MILFVQKRRRSEAEGFRRIYYPTEFDCLACIASLIRKVPELLMRCFRMFVHAGTAGPRDVEDLEGCSTILSPKCMRQSHADVRHGLRMSISLVVARRVDSWLLDVLQIPLLILSSLKCGDTIPQSP